MPRTDAIPHLILRADSGFCRDDLLAYCEEAEGVDYVIGVANNEPLRVTRAAPAGALWRPLRARASLPTFSANRVTYAG